MIQLGTVPCVGLLENESCFFATITLKLILIKHSMCQVQLLVPF